MRVNSFGGLVSFTKIDIESCVKNKSKNYYLRETVSGGITTNYDKNTK